jgi:DNA-binding MarR family transcriptional regulator
MDEVSNRLMEEFCKSLKKREVQRLAELLDKLCAGGEIPPGVERKVDLPLRAEFRRLARLMEVLLPGFMGSNLSSTEWQLLQAIRYSTSPLTAVDLVEQFGVEQSTLSRSLSRFRKAGFIKEIGDSRDGRAKRLQPLRKGAAALDAIDKAAETKLSCSLRHLSLTEGEELVSLLSLLTFGDSCSSRSLVTSFKKKERQQLRRWYLEELTEKKEQDIPAELIHPENFVIGINSVEENRWSGVVEFRKERAQLKLISCYFSEDKSLNYLDQLYLTVKALQRAVDQLKVRTIVTTQPLPLAFLDAERLFGLTLLRATT